MAKTIQEMLAEKARGDPQPVQYVDTVEAYDKWAEVRFDSFLVNYLNCHSHSTAF